MSWSIYMVEYLTKTFQDKAEKKIVMFAHNHVGHWISVVVIPKCNKVLYFDLLRTSKFNDVLNEYVLS